MTEIAMTSNDKSRKKTLIHSIVKNCSWEPARTDYYLNLLRALVTKDSDIVDSEDDSGTTALHHAVKQRNLEAVKIMRLAGANFGTIARSTGNSLLHSLAEKKWYDKPCDQSQIALFDLLIVASGNGIDVNALNNEGRTPLHVAVDCDNLVIVEKLLSRDDVDVDCRERGKRRTPLHLAVRNDSLELLELLLDHGARIDAKDHRRNATRPLHQAAAARSKNSSALRLLLERGAEVNARDSLGDSALVKAILADRTDNVEELLAHGADVNDRRVVRALAASRRRCDAADSALRHWLKLRVADLPCSRECERLATRRLEDHRQLASECSREVDALKSIAIDARGFRLYDWLRMDPNRRYVHARADRLRELLESPTRLAKRFPRYYPVIASCHRDSIRRRSLLGAASAAWITWTGIRLPDVCLERIFAHLNTGYLFEIVEFVDELDECKPTKKEIKPFV